MIFHVWASTERGGVSCKLGSVSPSCVLIYANGFVMKSERVKLCSLSLYFIGIPFFFEEIDKDKKTSGGPTNNFLAENQRRGEQD